MKMHSTVRSLHATYPLLRQQLMSLNLETRERCLPPPGHWARVANKVKLFRHFSAWAKMQIRSMLWLWDKSVVSPWGFGFCLGGVQVTVFLRVAAPAAAEA